MLRRFYSELLYEMHTTAVCVDVKDKKYDFGQVA